MGSLVDLVDSITFDSGALPFEVPVTVTRPSLAAIVTTGISGNAALSSTPMKYKPLSALSKSKSFRGRNAAIWRQSSEPMDPAAPVMRTVF